MKSLIRIGSMLAGFATACFFSAQATVPTMVDTAPQMRKVLIEEFTGIHCQYCPLGHLSANNVVDAHPGKAFVINYHQGGYAQPAASSDEQDLRTQWGDALFGQIGAEGYPSGSVNRHVFVGGITSTDYSKWNTYAPQVLSMPSYVNVASKATLDWSTRVLTVTVELYYTAQPSVASNFLNVAVLQDNIEETQSGAIRNPAQVLDNGKYNLMHTLRELLTGQWGEEITDLSNKKLVTKTYTYTIPDKIREVPMILDNLNVVVFVNENRKEVLNVTKPEMTYLNSPEFILQLKEASNVKNNSCDNNTTVSLKVLNNSSTPVENITFEVKTSLGTEEVTLPATGMTTGTDTYLVLTFNCPMNVRGEAEIKIVKVNGKAYTYNQKNSISVPVEKWGGATLDPSVTLKLVQDKYGAEITWDFIHGVDILTKGGPYRDLQNSGIRENTETLALATTGCYILKIYDLEKDGINNNYGSGYIEILNEKGNSIVKHDGKYKEMLEIFIKKTAVSNSVEKELTQNFTISPNPVSNQAVSLNFVLDAAKTLNISVYDLSGRSMINPILYNGQEGTNRTELSVNNLKAGIYMVSIRSNDGSTVVRKLVVR